MLISILRDIVKHTAALGFIDTIKVTGSETETLIESVNLKENLILKATLNQPSPDLLGTFGMNNLSVLAGYAEFPSFRADGATVTVSRRPRNGESVPEKITFTDHQGQSFNYRLMSKEVVQAQPELPAIDWDVSIVPEKGKVEEFRRLSSILGGVHKDFIPRTIEGDLRFYIGGENTATHDGFLIFQKNVKGKMPGTIAWSAAAFLNLVRFAEQESCEIQMSSQGLLALTVTSDFATYTFILGGKDAS
jgi:hypothetical protein